MGRGRRHLHWPPFPSVCTPIPWSPGGERLDSLCQHTGCLQVCRSAGTQHPACMDLVQIIWVLVDRTSETKQSFPEDSPHLRRLRRLAWLLLETCAPTVELLGAGRPRSPPSGMQSLLRMCACGCVCVFIRMLLKKQPSLWGSWTLHVRVSPESLARCPPPQGPLLSPNSVASLPVPCREKDCGKLQDSSHPPPSACLLGLPACLAQSPGVPHTHFLSPF